MPTHPQHQHGLPPRGPGPAQQQRNGLPSGAASLTRSPMPPDYGRSPTPGSTPSRTPARRLGTSQFRYYTLAQLEAMSKRQGTRASGWNAQLELKRRRNYVEWIHALCKCLGLPYVVIETAIFYMHRYFAFKVRQPVVPQTARMASTVYSHTSHCEEPCMLRPVMWYELDHADMQLTLDAQHCQGCDVIDAEAS